MKAKLTILALLLSALCSGLSAQNLKVNDLEYFEDTGVNFLVYSNNYTGMFCDEKTAAMIMAIVADDTAKIMTFFDI